jgi:hypothetical protein
MVMKGMTVMSCDGGVLAPALGSLLVEAWWKYR